MTEIRPLSHGQRVRAERARARRRAEAEAASGAQRPTDERPARTTFERETRASEPEADLAPDLQLHAQLAADFRRGLRAGPLVHGTARRTYLGTEYAGRADRRARSGRKLSTSV